MAVFDTFFDEVAEPTLTEHIFGKVGSFTPASGPVLAGVYGVVSESENIEPTGYDSTSVTVGTVLELRVSVVGEVHQGDTWTDGTTTYTCKREIENNGSITKWQV